MMQPIVLIFSTDTLGARVAVFSSSRSRRTLDPVANKFGVRAFGMPIGFGELSEILEGR